MRKPNDPQPKILGQEDVQRWLLAFQKAISECNEPAVEKLFHINTIGFECGLRSALTIDDIIGHHWLCLCPNTQHAFSFLMADARVIPAPGMFAVAIKYMTTRKIIGCEPEFGQITFILLDFEGKLLCVHSHVSETI